MQDICLQIFRSFTIQPHVPGRISKIVQAKPISYYSTTKMYWNECSQKYAMLSSGTWLGFIFQFFALADIQSSSSGDSFELVMPKLVKVISLDNSAIKSKEGTSRRDTFNCSGYGVARKVQLSDKLSPPSTLLCLFFTLRLASAQQIMSVKKEPKAE